MQTYYLKKLVCISFIFINAYASYKDSELVIQDHINEEDFLDELYYKNNSLDEFKKPFIVISLGHLCFPALHLRAFGLAEYSFPLNWVNSPFAGLYKLFVNDFKDYFSKDHLVDMGHIVKSNVYVYEKVYSITSNHDFTIGQPILSQADAIKKKYDRRVERLYRALNSNKKIYFFRTLISKEEVLQFVELINRKFPKLNYTFVAINNTEEYKKKWHVAKVKNFYMNDIEAYPNYKNWYEIFKELKLVNTFALVNSHVSDSTFAN